MSSTLPIELSSGQMHTELERLLDRKVVGVERIGGGFNSQVYRVVTFGEKAFALKVYFRQADDKRDRLGTEYGSFSWLWESGFREIPQPLVSDTTLGWAIYQYIDGEKIPRGQVSDVQISLAANFLGRLRGVSRTERSAGFGPASEAFFAAGQIVDSVRRRLVRLETATGTAEPYSALRSFLENEFKPFLEQVTRWSDAHLQSAGLSFDRELDPAERTLSPSDFGFHNALRQRDGRIIFLDFEYFGWDDPAKMISDFLLHPAMEFSASLKKQFASIMFRHFSDWPWLVGRVESVYPLFGLKWCMIILNEFLPDQYLRRQFAAMAAADRSALQLQQLDKARAMLERMRAEYQRFPYS